MQSHLRKAHRDLGLLSLHKWKQSSDLSIRQAFLEGYGVVMTSVRIFTTVLYQGKWSRFLQLVHGRNVSPCKATVQQEADFFSTFAGCGFVFIPVIEAVEQLSTMLLS